MSLIDSMLHPPFQLELPHIQHRFEKLRVLLALDGQQLTPELQIVALKCCVHWTRRLDILLVNPPQAPTFLLGGLLLKLEHSGIDYRLNSREGEFGQEVVRYLQRVNGVGLVIVNALSALEHYVQMHQINLQQKQQRYVDLTEPERLRRLGETD